MNKKKILVSLAVVVGTVVGASALGAFEAHVVNVTAKIENALAVSPKELEFDTVFPQEVLHKDLEIELSDSFVDAERVDDVEYKIVQKLKPVPADYEGDLELLDDNEGDGQYYPSLCEYLSKHKHGEDMDEGQEEEEVDSFHGGRYLATSGHVTYEDDATGYLSKMEEDIVDVWDIDLAVPCFGELGDQCSQDWPDFFMANGGKEGMNPWEWTLDKDLESAMFGCDLWVEVTGISEQEIEFEKVPDSGQNATNESNGWPYIGYTINGDCIDFEFNNPTPWFFVFDYRVDGEEGELHEWSDVVIHGGELAGDEIGPKYNWVETNGPETKEVTVCGEDEIWVGLRVGAEQDYYLDWIKFSAM